MRWCFTLNNPPDLLDTIDWTNVRCAVWSREIGDSGTPHYQGYMCMLKQTKLGGMKKLIEGAHFESCKGNHAQNIAYCTKDPKEGPWWYPDEATVRDYKGQGNRTDIDKLIEKMDSGATVSEIRRDMPSMLLYHRPSIIAEVAARLPPPPDERDVTGLVLWGPTATGKTHYAVHTWHPFFVNPGRGPWDKYESQKTICFDEFDYNNWPITFMNRVLDKWPLDLDCRYANKSAYWTRVLILANSDPASWYVFEPPAVREAFARRIVVVRIESRADIESLPPSPSP